MRKKKLNKMRQHEKKAKKLKARRHHFSGGSTLDVKKRGAIIILDINQILHL